MNPVTLSSVRPKWLAKSKRPNAGNNKSRKFKDPSAKRPIMPTHRKNLASPKPLLLHHQEHKWSQYRMTFNLLRMNPETHPKSFNIQSNKEIVQSNRVPKANRLV